MSWICTSKSGKTIEIRDKRNADTLRRLGWTVEDALTYLGRINREIKADPEFYIWIGSKAE